MVKQKVGAKPRAEASESRAQVRLPTGCPRESGVAGSVGEQVRAAWWYRLSELLHLTFRLVIGAGSCVSQVGVRSPQGTDKSNQCLKRMKPPGGRCGAHVRGTSNQLRVRGLRR